MKLLIIGGSGLLSGAVMDEALRNGIEVTVINRGNRKRSYKKRFTKIYRWKY